jgi:hypothetical protein
MFETYALAGLTLTLACGVVSICTLPALLQQKSSHQPANRQQHFNNTSPVRPLIVAPNVWLCERGGKQNDQKIKIGI